MGREVDMTYQAVHELRQIAKWWPKSLWLFSGNGVLYVMRKTEDGKRAMTANGGVDPAYIIDTVNIENDGGDW